VNRVPPLTAEAERGLRLVHQPWAGNEGWCADEDCGSWPCDYAKIFSSLDVARGKTASACTCPDFGDPIGALCPVHER
jgi:hypothetical protein